MKNLSAIMCGIDVHDNTLVCRIGINSESPKTKITKNTLKQRFQLFEHLKKLADKAKISRIVVAYEASTVGFCIHDDCLDAGIECYILAPTKMRKSRDDVKRKNDKKDADIILETLRGHVLAGNPLPKIWIPDSKTRDDRELVRARLDLVKKQTAVKTQIQTLLKRHRKKRPPEMKENWTKKYSKWLEDLVLELEEESHKGGSIALSTLMRQLFAIKSEIDILDKAIEELFETERYKEPGRILVEGIKGIGLLTAMVFLTEMGDLRRFKNRKKIGAFLGLVPTTNESGEKNDRKGHITHAGPARVRGILCQSVLSRIRWDKREAIHYEKIVKRNPKRKKIAVVACMRRLAILMWHLALEAQEKNNVFDKAA